MNPYSPIPEFLRSQFPDVEEIRPDTGGISPDEWRTFLASRPWLHLKRSLELTLEKHNTHLWLEAVDLNRLSFLKGRVDVLSTFLRLPDTMLLDAQTETNRKEQSNA